MPIFMRNTTDVKPFEGPREAGPDVSLHGTGFQLPAAVDVQHEVTNKAVDLSFALAGDVNGDGRFDLDIQLLVPAVLPTDFHSG